jgi:hypothetical protein
MLGNWIRQHTTTSGTGNLTLTSITGFDVFSDQFFPSSVPEIFRYIINDGNNWESGRGHLSASNTLVRDRVDATFVSGTYTSQTGSGTAITLVGTSNLIDATAAAIVFVDLDCLTGDLVAVTNATSATGGVCPRNIATTNIGAVTTTSPNTGFVWYWPILMPLGGVFSGIVINVQTTNSATAYFAIYSVNVDGSPYRLIAKTALTTLSTGAQNIAFTANALLRPKWYYLAGTFNVGTPAIVAPNAYALLMGGNPLGCDSNGQPLNYSAISTAFVSPADPATAPNTFNNDRTNPFVTLVKA